MYKVFINSTNHAYAYKMEDIETYEFIQYNIEELVYEGDIILLCDDLLILQQKLPDLNIEEI